MLMDQFVNVCVCFSLVLQLFCSSPKAALRYAAVRTLNKVQLLTPARFCMAGFLKR